VDREAAKRRARSGAPACESCGVLRYCAYTSRYMHTHARNNQPACESAAVASAAVAAASSGPSADVACRDPGGAGRRREGWR
jgi:hypothetical protein